MTTEEKPAARPERRAASPRKTRKLADAGKQHPWMLAGTLLGGLGTLLAAIVSGAALLVRDDPEPVISPPVAAGNDPSATTRASPPGPYTFTGPPIDHEGIHVSVPDQWPIRKLDRWHARSLNPIPENTVLGPGVNAAPSVEEWAKAAAPVPGVFVGVSRDPDLLRAFSPRDLLGSIELAPCLPTGPIEDDTTAGEISAVIEHDCGGGTTWYSRAWTSRSRDYIALLQVKLTSAEDQRALRRILNLDVVP